MIHYLRNGKSFSFIRNFPDISGIEVCFQSLNDYYIFHCRKKDENFYKYWPVKKRDKIIMFKSESEFDEEDFVQLIIGIAMGSFAGKGKGKSVQDTLFADVDRSEVKDTFYQCLKDTKDAVFFPKLYNEFIMDVADPEKVVFYDKGTSITCHYKKYKQSFVFDIALKYFLIYRMGPDFFKYPSKVKTHIIQAQNKALVPSDNLNKEISKKSMLTLTPEKEDVDNFKLAAEHSRDCLPILLDFIYAYNNKTIDFNEVELNGFIDDQPHNYIVFNSFALNQLAQFELIGDHYKRYYQFFRWFIKLGRIMAFVVNNGIITAAQTMEVANINHIQSKKLKRKTYYTVPVRLDALTYWDESKSYQNLLPNLSQTVIKKYDYRSAVYFFLNKFEDGRVTLGKLFELCNFKIDRAHRVRNIRKAENVLKYVAEETHKISGFKIINKDTKHVKDIIFEYVTNKALSN